MTYYAINGSPRKTHNTATILNKALEGVKAADPQAQTELIHLYSHDFSGCVSCFECKRVARIDARDRTGENLMFLAGELVVDHVALGFLQPLDARSWPPPVWR